MTQYYGKIRFPIAPGGHYTEQWCQFTCVDLVDASRLFTAFRLGYYIATQSPPGIWTITQNRPKDASNMPTKIFDLTGDQGRNDLMAHIAELKEKSSI